MEYNLQKTVDILWQRFAVIDRLCQQNNCKESIAPRDAEDKAEIFSLKNYIKDLQQQISDTQKKNVSLNNQLSDLISYQKKKLDRASEVHEQFINTLSEVILELKKGGYIISCDGNRSGIEEANLMELCLANGAEETASRIMSIDMTGVETANDARKKIADCIFEELTESPMNWMSTLGIYSAYAQIPFIIDVQRVSGLRFDRQVIMSVYALLDDLLSTIGLKQIIPAPFVESFNETALFYENVTGHVVSNIESFCSEARQHLERVDRSNVTNIIFDIAEVGISSKGKTIKKAKILL